MPIKQILITTIAAALLMGCASTKHVAKQDALNVLHEFFHNMGVEKYDRDNFQAIVTDDFHIYERGMNMSRSEFFNFVEGMRSDSSISRDWVLSDFQIATDNRSAHISYKNVGTFVSKTAGGNKEVSKIEWLENAYFVQYGGRLKIKFLHSQELKKETSRN
jgi:hypothetical protein